MYRISEDFKAQLTRLQELDHYASDELIQRTLEDGQCTWNEKLDLEDYMEEGLMHKQDLHLCVGIAICFHQYLDFNSKHEMEDFYALSKAFIEDKTEVACWDNGLGLRQDAFANAEGWKDVYAFLGERISAHNWDHSEIRVLSKTLIEMWKRMSPVEGLIHEGTVEYTHVSDESEMRSKYRFIDRINGFIGGDRLAIQMAEQLATHANAHLIMDILLLEPDWRVTGEDAIRRTLAPCIDGTQFKFPWVLEKVVQSESRLAILKDAFKDNKYFRKGLAFAQEGEYFDLEDHFDADYIAALGQAESEKGQRTRVRLEWEYPNRVAMTEVIAGAVSEEDIREWLGTEATFEEHFRDEIMDWDSLLHEFGANGGPEIAVFEDGSKVKIPMWTFFGSEEHQDIPGPDDFKGLEPGFYHVTQLTEVGSYYSYSVDVEYICDVHSFSAHQECGLFNDGELDTDFEKVDVTKDESTYATRGKDAVSTLFFVDDEGKVVPLSNYPDEETQASIESLLS